MIECEDGCLEVIEFANSALFNRPKAFKRFFGLFILRHIIRCFCEKLNQIVHIIDIDSLVHRQAYPPFGCIVEIDAQFFGFDFDFGFGVVIHADFEGIEELRVLLVVAIGLQHLAKINGFAVDSFCDRADTFSPMVNTIHTSHHCGECFSGTDIRSRFLAFDMLLACLQSKAVSGVFVFIFAQTDNSSGHVPLVLVTGSHISGSRSTKAHRQAETLRCTAHDIRSKRFEQRQSHQISHYRHFQSGSVAVLYEGLVVLYRAIGVRPLNECSEKLIVRFKISV